MYNSLVYATRKVKILHIHNVLNKPYNIVSRLLHKNSNTSAECFVATFALIQAINTIYLDKQYLSFFKKNNVSLTLIIIPHLYCSSWAIIKTWHKEIIRITFIGRFIIPMALRVYATNSIMGSATQSIIVHISVICKNNKNDNTNKWLNHKFAKFQHCDVMQLFAIKYFTFLFYCS